MIDALCAVGDVNGARPVLAALTPKDNLATGKVLVSTARVLKAEGRINEAIAKVRKEETKNDFILDFLRSSFVFFQLDEAEAVLSRHETDEPVWLTRQKAQPVMDIIARLRTFYTTGAGDEFFVTPKVRMSRFVFCVLCLTCLFFLAISATTSSTTTNASDTGRTGESKRKFSEFKIVFFRRVLLLFLLLFTLPLRQRRKWSNQRRCRARLLILHKNPLLRMFLST